jgi:hypothetical protein
LERSSSKRLSCPGTTERMALILLFLKMHFIFAPFERPDDRQPPASFLKNDF